MPQTHSAEKALRVSARRRLINDRWKRKIRESLKSIREARAKNEPKTLSSAITEAESVLDRAARHDVIHWREAARRKSRLRANS